MQKIKVLFLVLIAISVLILIFIIYPPGTPSRSTIQFVILDNSLIGPYYPKIIEHINEIYPENFPNELIIKVESFVNLDTSTKIISRKPADNDIIWASKVKNEIEYFLKSIANQKIEITNENCNEILIKNLKKILNTESSKNHFLILTGSFPKCYDSIALTDFIRQFDELQKSKKNNNVNLVWSVIDNRKIENQVIDYLNKTKLFSIMDHKILLTKSRECEDLQNKVFVLFYDTLNEKEFNNFIDRLHEKFGNVFKLIGFNKIHTDGFNVIINKGDNINELVEKYSISQQKSEWKELGQLFRNALKTMESQDTSIQKHFYIVGNLPSESYEIQIKSDDWLRLSSIKNLENYFYLPQSKRLNKVDKALMLGFKKYNLKFYELRG